MSIATDEALEWHGLHGDEPGDRDSTYSAEELDAAYIAGRTADVTDAEVKSAMNELYGHGYCCREGATIVCMCGAKLKNSHEYDTHLLRAMLEKAREAVTE